MPRPPKRSLTLAERCAIERERRVSDLAAGKRLTRASTAAMRGWELLPREDTRHHHFGIGRRHPELVKRIGDRPSLVCSQEGYGA